MRTTLLKRAFAAAVGSARPLDDALMLIGFPQSGKTLANRHNEELAQALNREGAAPGADGAPDHLAGTGLAGGIAAVDEVDQDIGVEPEPLSAHRRPAPGARRRRPHG